MSFLELRLSKTVWVHILIQFYFQRAGHFYLTHLLLDKLKASAPSRVVTVSADAHIFYPLDFNDLQTERGWSFPTAYGRSKTANILFSQHLATLMNGTSVAGCIVGVQWAG